MRVFGIRNEAQENPIFGDYVVDSVCLLNKRFNPQGRYFYFDEGNVTQQFIGGHRVFDMYGWVVDEADVAELEPLWLSNADRKGSSDGSSPMDRFLPCVGHLGGPQRRAVRLGQVHHRLRNIRGRGAVATPKCQPPTKAIGS